MNTERTQSRSEKSKSLFFARICATLLLLICTAAGVVTLRAAEPGKPAEPSKNAPAASAPPTTTTGTQSDPKAAQPAKAGDKGQQPAGEDSTTIRDDPTVAPDPQESADNNVSFPVDI